MTKKGQNGPKKAPKGPKSPKQAQNGLKPLKLAHVNQYAPEGILPSRKGVVAVVSAGRSVA